MTKRIFTYLLLILVSGILLNACTKESMNPPGPGEGPDGPKPQESGLFSIRFTEPLLTKSESEEYGTAYEQTIRNVWVLLYGYDKEEYEIFDGSQTIRGTDHLLKYAWNLDIKKGISDEVYNGKDIAANKGYKYGFVTKARPVERQKYKLVVIANPGFYAGKNSHHSLVHFTNGDYSSGSWTEYSEDTGSIVVSYEEHWSLLEHLYEADCGDWRIDEIKPELHLFERSGDDVPAYFLMSNANEVVDVREKHILDSPEEAEEFPVPINIDRAVAKVMVNMGSKNVVHTTTGGTVTNAVWGLKNVNKKSYLYRHFAPMFNPFESGYHYEGDMETPEDNLNTLRVYKYATDPNFYNQKNKEEGYWEENFRNETPDQFVGWNAFGDSGLEEKNWKYIPENTLDYESQENSPAGRGTFLGWSIPDFVTKVAFRIHIAYDFGEGYEDDQGDYYSYSIGYGDDRIYRVFSHKQVLEWIETGEFPKDTDDPQGYWGLKERIESSGFFEQGVNSSKPLPADYTDENNVTHVIDDDNSAGSGIYFHPGGLNEYEVPITHFNFSGMSGLGPNNSYGYIGVVRNNVYRVTINSINGPGIPSSPTHYLSVNVNVNPWYIREQIEDV